MKARPLKYQEEKNHLLIGVDNTVAYPSGHVWNYRRLRPRHRCAHRG